MLLSPLFVSRLRHLAAVFIVNSGILVAGILLLEVFYGNWWQQNPLARLNLNQNFNLTIVLPGYMVLPGEKYNIHYKTDPYGFRGKYPTPASIDVLTLGGSTTAQIHVSEGETWQDVIAKDFLRNGKTVHIANAGIEGQTSYGHMRNFKLWLSKIPNLKPKYILVYVGINDLMLLPNHYHDVLEETPTPWALFKRRSAMYLIYRSVLGWHWTMVKRTHRYKYSPFEINWTDKPACKNLSEFMPPYLKSYEERLNRLVSEIMAFGSKPIFVTQATGNFKVVDGKVFGNEIVSESNGLSLNGVDEYYFLMALNQTLLKVCRQAQGICIDLASELSFEDTDFYDAEHTNAKGSAKIGHYLYKKLTPYF